MTDVKDTLATWLNHQLRLKGWSVRQLAREAHLSHSTVARMSNDQGPFSARSLNAVADTFGVPREEVQRLAGLLRPARAQTEGVGVLIERLEAMPDAWREETLALISAILDYRRLVTAPLDEAAERVSLFEKLFSSLTEDEQDAVIAELQARVDEQEAGPSTD